MAHLAKDKKRQSKPFSIENYKRVKRRIERLKLSMDKETVTGEMRSAYQEELEHLERISQGWDAKYREIQQG